MVAIKTTRRESCFLIIQSRHPGRRGVGCGPQPWKRVRSFCVIAGRYTQWNCSLFPLNLHFALGSFDSIKNLVSKSYHLMLGTILPGSLSQSSSTCMVCLQVSESVGPSPSRHSNLWVQRGRRWDQSEEQTEMPTNVHLCSPANGQ